MSVTDKHQHAGAVTRVPTQANRRVPPPAADAAVEERIAHWQQRLDRARATAGEAPADGMLPAHPDF